MSAAELIKVEASPETLPGTLPLRWGEACVASDAAVRAELWISFVALMRSHLAAQASLGVLAHVSLLETSPTSFIVKDLSTTLSVSISLENGRGTYRVERSGCKSATGAWHLGVHAAVSIDQGPDEDMDLGLEALAAKLWMQEPLAPLPEGNH